MNLTQVTSIDANLPCEIFLTQGAVPSLKIETDEATKEQVVTEIADHTLKLRFKGNDAQAIKVFITLQNLEELNLENASLGTTSPINTNTLKINLIGNGVLNMHINAKTLNFTGNGDPIVTLKGTADEQIIKLSGMNFRYFAETMQSTKVTLDGSDEDMNASTDKKTISLNTNEATITKCSRNTKIYFTHKPTILNNNSLAELKGLLQE